jgi:hypothetical protein
MRETVEGSRTVPTPPGLFRTIIKHRTGSFSCGVIAGEDVGLAPGREYDAQILVLLEDARAGFMMDDDIELWEGKTIATGKVIGKS